MYLLLLPLRWANISLSTDERAPNGSLESRSGAARCVLGRWAGAAVTDRFSAPGGPKYPTGTSDWLADLSLSGGSIVARAFDIHGRRDHHPRPPIRRRHEGFQHQPSLEAATRSDRLRREWAAGNRDAVLGADDVSTNTGKRKRPRDFFLNWDGLIRPGLDERSKSQNG